MFEEKFGIMPNNFSLILDIDFEELNDYLGTTLVHPNVVLEQLERLGHSPITIATYFFFIGMFVKEKFDEAHIDLKNNFIDGIQLPKTMGIVLNIVLNNLKG